MLEPDQLYSDSTGETPDSLGAEFSTIMRKAKQKHIRGRAFWHLQFVARHPQCTLPRVASSLIRPYLETAKRSGLPVWVAASNAHARDVYIHLGFKLVESMVVGKGRIDSLGNRDVNGEGTGLWGLIIEPISISR